MRTLVCALLLLSAAACGDDDDDDTTDADGDADADADADTDADSDTDADADGDGDGDADGDADADADGDGDADADGDADGDGDVACGGRAGDTCGADEFCDFAGPGCDFADAQGICAARPEACPQGIAQVCGCNGVTYAGECAAHQAGTDVAADGPCSSDQ